MKYITFKDMGLKRCSHCGGLVPIENSMSVAQHRLIEKGLMMVFILEAFCDRFPEIAKMINTVANIDTMISEIAEDIHDDIREMFGE